MKYLHSTFSVGGASEAYSAGWRQTFGPPAKYRAILGETSLLRASGQLSQEQEFEFAGKADELWNQLTDEEQAEIEFVATDSPSSA